MRFKKVMAVLLTIVMVAVQLPIIASAADAPNVQFTFKSDKNGGVVKPGDEITYMVATGAVNEGFAMGTLFFRASDNLEYVSALDLTDPEDPTDITEDVTKAVAGENLGAYGYPVSSTKNYTKTNRDYLSITFKVKDGAEEGVSVEFYTYQLINKDSAPIAVAVNHKDGEEDKSSAKEENVVAGLNVDLICTIYGPDSVAREKEIARPGDTIDVLLVPGVIAGIYRGSFNLKTKGLELTGTHEYTSTWETTDTSDGTVLSLTATADDEDLSAAGANLYMLTFTVSEDVTESPSITLSSDGFTNKAGAKVSVAINGSVGEDTVTFDFFVPVSGINGVPASIAQNTDVTLPTTAVPANATNKTIVWSIKNAGETGAALDGTVLKAAEIGKVTVTATVANGSNPDEDFAKDFEISVTKHPDRIAVETAADEISGIDFGSMAQADAVDEDAIKAFISEKIADSTADITVTITKTAFTDAVTGDPADADGTDGEYCFTIKLSKGEYEVTTDEFAVGIIATAYEGITYAQALEKAVNAINAATFNDMPQADGNSASEIWTNYLGEKISSILIAERLDPETLGYTLSYSKTLNVTPAVAGSPSTTHEGTNGEVSFSIKFIAGTDGIGGNASTSAKTFDIIATAYTGLLDSEAVAAAKTSIEALTWDDVAQATANTESALETLVLDKIKEVAGDVEVELTNINFTAAVAGSSSTTHEGTNGSFSFKVAIHTNTESAEVNTNSFKVIATAYTGLLDSEAVAAAKTAIESLTWDDVAQAKANTEAALKALVLDKIKEVAGDVDVELTNIAFTAAVAGSSSTTHEGTNGSFGFKVSITKGAESATVDTNSFNIIATAYTGLLDSEAVAAAKTAIEALTWDDVAQATANTESALKTLVLDKIKEVAGDVDVELTNITFTAAVAGSSSTTHEGTNGSFGFKVSITKGAESATVDTNSFNVIATAYTGLLDSEAVAAAKTAIEALTWDDVAQATANTESVLKALVLDKIKEVAGDVDVELTNITFTAAVAGSSSTTHEGTNGSFGFKVAITKGAESATVDTNSFDIIATAYTGLLDSEAVAAAKTAIEALTWDDVAQATANTESALKTLVLDKIKEVAGDVDAELTNIAFTAAVAGSSSTTHEGTNGSFGFKTKITKGAESATVDTNSFNIIATAYTGLLDSEAVAAAKTAIEALTWDDVAQATANTESALKNLVLDKIKEVAGDVDAELTNINFTAAVAGSSSTTHEGTNGSFGFKTKITKGAESATVDTNSFSVIATAYTGLLDSEAVAAAKAAIEALTWDDVAQTTANTEDALKNLVLDKIKEAAGDVEVELTNINFTAAVAGSSSTTHEGTNGSFGFKTKITKGAESATVDTNSFNVIATAYTGLLDSEAVAAAKAAIEALTWDDVAQTTANTESALKTLVLDKIKEVAGDVDVELTNIAFTAAVAGSSSTTHEGTNGSFSFKVAIHTNTESAEVNTNSFDIIATEYTGLLDSEAVAAAKTAIEALTWDDVAQATANTESALKTLVLNKIKEVAGDVEVELTNINFTAAVAGSSSTTHEGTNGSFGFKVSITKGTESATVDTNSFNIIATAYTGLLDSEAVAAAKTAIEALTWDDVAQAKANTESALKTLVIDKIKEVAGDVEVELTNINFTAAVAGSSSTTHEGTNGSFSFKTKITKGAESATVDTNSFNIIATAYTGLLDSEAVAAAKTAIETLTWDDVAQATANTESALKTLVLDKIKEVAGDVDAELTNIAFTAAVAGSSSTTHEGTNGSFGFKVSITKGAESATVDTNSFNIIATAYTGLLDSEAVAAAKAAIEALTWDDVAQATANTESALKTLVLDKIKEVAGDVDVELTNIAFTAAVAGSSSTTHEGTNGSFSFKTKITKGAESATVDTNSFNVIATAYTGLLDSEAVAAAKTAIESLTWDDVAQATANTEDALKNLVLDKIKEVAGDVDVELTNIAFTAAVAGSSSTTHEGTNGSFSFKVAITKGAESATVDTNSFDIIATAYTGLLDSEAVAAAKTAIEALTWDDVAQATANTESVLKALVLDKIKEVAGDVDVELTNINFTAAVAGSSSTTHEGTDGSFGFKVAITKGAESATVDTNSFNIIATAYTGLLDSEAVAAAKTAIESLTWDDVAQATANTESALKTLVLDKIKEVAGDVDVELTNITFTAAVAGSSSTTHEGTNGSFGFKVAITKGAESATVDTNSFNIIATAYTGLLDSEAVAAAKTAIEALTWDDVAQAKANTESALKDIVLNKTKNSNGVTATVETVAFTPAEAGTATDVAGTNGSFTFRIILSKGAESATLSAKSFGIIATEYVAPPQNDWIADYFRGYVLWKLRQEKLEAEKDKIDKPVQEDKWNNPFTDVSEKDEFYDSVRFVFEKKLFLGTSDTTFSPEKTMTRAMFVTVLGRLANVDESKYTGSSFSDTEDGQWYSAYVKWAAEEGIVLGYGNGKFGVNDQITVQQAAVIIARFASYVGFDMTADDASASYADTADVADWAKAEMNWVIENGIYEGRDGKLSPKELAPRSLVATMIHRFAEGFIN